MDSILYITYFECGKQALPLAFERHTQTLGTPNEQTNDEICVLFDVLAIDPHAETQKVQVSFTLHWIPADVGIVFG